MIKIKIYDFRWVLGYGSVGGRGASAARGSCGATLNLPPESSLKKREPRGIENATLAPEQGLFGRRDGAAATRKYAGPDAGGGGGDEPGPGGPQPAAAGGPPGPGGETDPAAGGDGESGRGSGAGPPVHRTDATEDGRPRRPQTFMEMFEATAAACGWPTEWAVRLLPLLSGDAQSAALGLPAPSR